MEESGYLNDRVTAEQRIKDQKDERERWESWKIHSEEYKEFMEWKNNVKAKPNG